jgi:hypothetical protein
VRFFKKSDLIVVFSLLAVALVAWFFHNSGTAGVAAKAEIYYGSDLVRTIDLTNPSPGRFTLPQNKHVVFEVTADGSIRFYSSDCPDKICVKTGFLHRVGETAACIPNQFFLRLIPAKGKAGENRPDVIVG